MEVLTCVTQGKSNKEIANLLGISHQTVKNIMSEALHRLDATNRVDAVVQAIRRGEIELGRG